MRPLVLLGPCPSWSAAVRSGRFVADPTSVPMSVAVVVGPQSSPGSHDEEALMRARDRTGGLIERRSDGVLPLLAVMPVDGRIGWVYPAHEGVSLAVAAGLTDGALPLRGAAEIVASVARALEPMVAAGLIHPGVGADDVLLGADGTVAVANFVGPFAQAPVYRDPRGAEDGSAVVWRLGVLLAQLLTGTLPTAGADRGSHDLAVRRLLVRIMSRPGPMVPERFRDWVTGMLAWDADLRPALSRIGPGLRELAATLPGPELATLAAQVPALRARADGGEAAGPRLDRMDVDLDRIDTDRTEDARTDEARTEEARTEEAALSDHPVTDDITAISGDGDPPRFVVGAPELGTIPVQVGPPPEAVRRGRLPRDLFAANAAGDTTEVSASLRSRPVGLIAGSLLLAAAAAALAVYLLR